jgi:hypothetical protein
MKFTKSTIWAFVLLLLLGSIFRVLDVWQIRTYGLAPQVAMALFGGAVIKDKRLAFILPLLSLFISDVLYEVFYSLDLTKISGFYKGQWANYLLLAAITLFGMLMKKINVKNVIGFSISSSVVFFTFSNFFVWLAGEGLKRPKTFEGLMQCYTDALAFHSERGLIQGFFANPVLSDLIFSAILFGSYYFIAVHNTRRVAVASSPNQ